VSKEKKFGRDFKRFFLRGLGAVLPTILTLMILVYIYDFVQEKVGGFVDDKVGLLIEHTALGDLLTLGIWESYFSWWISFVLVVIAVYLFGRFVGSYIGRVFWRLVERMLTRTPLIRQIYPSLKQVTDFLFSETKLDFSRVVAVEYPRKGMWSLGLVTGSGLRGIREATGSEMVTVFIPSSPTPVTGYTITVSRHEIIDLPLTIDEALRYTISGGVVTPLNQLPREERTVAGRLPASKTERQGETERKSQAPPVGAAEAQESPE
jgi:uncharacterized membrane protein